MVGTNPIAITGISQPSRLSVLKLVSTLDERVKLKHQPTLKVHINPICLF
jgi:hypothetical protein